MHISHTLEKKVGINLRSIKSALDIGCGTGRDANSLAQRGIDVHAIDIVPLKISYEKVKFTEISFQNYIPPQYFDLVYAIHVIPYLHHPTEQLQRMLGMGRYVFFNVFGPEHNRGGINRFTKEEMLQLLHEKKKTILYVAEEKIIVKEKLDQQHLCWFIVQ
jgi:predicted TPR repeat methyltransferase